VVFKIGSGSGFEYFEPRLARLRLEVFEPMLFISCQVFKEVITYGHSQEDNGFIDFKLNENKFFFSELDGYEINDISLQLEVI
jgi:hypothetical protein